MLGIICASLFLSAAPLLAKASTVRLPLNGQVNIDGPFSEEPSDFIVFELFFTLIGGGDYVGPPLPPDADITGPFFGYFININAGGANLEGCFSSELESLCGRALTPDPFAIVSPGFPLTIDTEISLRDVSPLQIELFADLPDGFFVTPLPTTLPLFLTGLGVLGLLSRKREKEPTGVRVTDLG